MAFLPAILEGSSSGTLAPAAGTLSGSLPAPTTGAGGAGGDLGESAEAAIAELGQLISSLGTLSTQAQGLPLTPPTLPGLPQSQNYQRQPTDYSQLFDGDGSGS